ncbi:uncharacterized protein [Miscanthus floridulus]|uniref:uncharacterized protein n=1 Tax=Miscanthus floridulus TaxID=154761 RepID=UPI0034588DA6
MVEEDQQQQAVVQLQEFDGRYMRDFESEIIMRPPDDSRQHAVVNYSKSCKLVEEKIKIIKMQYIDWDGMQEKEEPEFDKKLGHNFVDLIPLDDCPAIVETGENLARGIFNQLAAVFGEAKPEKSDNEADALPRRLVLFRAHSHSHGGLRVVATDLHSLAWHSSSSARGPDTAELVATKAKGLPRITISLDRVAASVLKDVIADFSLALYESYKTKQEHASREQDQVSQLMQSLASGKKRSNAKTT